MKPTFYFLFIFMISFKFSISQVSQLILNDPDKVSPTNVRSKPGGDVIGTIDSREEMALVKVLSKEGNYFLVSAYELCGRDEVVLSKKGYIHYSVLGAFISNYAKKPIPVYDSENKLTPSRKVYYSDEFFNILDSKKDMYLVFRKKSNEKFWIESKYFCFSPCTTCN